MISSLRILVVTACLSGSIAAVAATMDIYANFSPSVDEPERNVFVNTTPQSGFCKIWPHYCPTGFFSIELPITTTITVPIVANGEPRNSPYFKFPNKFKTVSITRDGGLTTSDVQFRISGFSARFSRNIGQHNWVRGSFVNAPSPCIDSPVSVIGGESYYHFLWKVPLSADSACYKISSIDRTEPSRFYNMSVGYELVTPNPLQLDSGIYKGSTTFTVGPGGDFDFGDNYQASDNVVHVNFILIVNHELKLTTLADQHIVSLQPCAKGSVCQEDEGQANWERWMANRVTPLLTGRSSFSLSSSGSFTIYLNCEQQIDSDCALKSDNNPSQLVPVQSLLTLSNNIVTDTGATVSKVRLLTRKDMTKNIFITKKYGQDRNGSIDFVVSQRDVGSMLRTRPDFYRGAITVIVDPVLY